MVPIPGTTKRAAWKKISRASAIELTRDDLREIDDAASKIQVQGARYPESLERLTGRCNGVVMPLANARVELWDSDANGSTIFDEFMAGSVTNQNGHFELDGLGGNPGSYSWSKPDVYARVTLTDADLTQNPVRLTDELNDERTWDSPEHDHDDSEGSVQIGSFTWGTDASWTQQLQSMRRLDRGAAEIPRLQNAQ